MKTNTNCSTHPFGGRVLRVDSTTGDVYDVNVQRFPPRPFFARRRRFDLKISMCPLFRNISCATEALTSKWMNGKTIFSVKYRPTIDSQIPETTALFTLYGY